MTSDLQRRKITTVFTAMDADADGFLTESDFVALTDRWLELRGTPDAAVRSVMMGWWATLLAASDLDRDNKVTFDEVLSVVDRLPTMTDVVEATADAMFTVADENADGLVDAGEYRQMIEAWRGVDTDTDTVFPLLDGDGDGRLSRSEFRELWYEFWAGDNAAAPGTLVFGPLA
ncbi:EF-hand domain-containing protein [Actinocrispum wychmicini]|uniref:Ca2+-binding EF-hand superfamily protein n=1 Tax=Actinocrispum wychmicini TaxID=1213861 RepID=A0A4R2JDT2_9PSEU|nr:EF-hand domain-containing protein [Actinocrispum wychmicini]TCO54996.1 Ca2+-binding EF-hand superfamily protein [Actinocrispum wychmicini]